MRISRPILIATIVSMLASAVVFGQTVQKRKTQPRTNPSTATDKTRSRIVKPADSVPTNQSVETQPTTATDKTPEAATSGPANASASTGEAQPTKKPSENVPETPSQPSSTETSTPTVSDPIMALRDEIDGASTPQDRIRLQLKLADLLVSNGRKSEALNELHAISALQVFDPTGFYNAGNALARLGDTNEAISAYHKAVEQRKGRYSRALNNLGVVLLRAGRWDESQDAFLAALKVEGFRYPEASYNLGRLYAARGQTDLAVREWRRALAVDPGHQAAAQSLAHAGSDDRITVESPAAVTTARTGNRTDPSSVTTATALERSAKAKPAPSGISTKPLSLDQMSFGFLQKARAASERGNTLEAIANYQRVIARQGGYFAPANLEMSYLLIGLKRNDEALGTLLQVSTRDGSRYPISHYHLGRLYEIKGELRLAEASYTHTVAAYTRNGQFLLDLSRIREKLGDLKGALEAMEKFLALVKNDGQDLVWPEERVTALRQKIAAGPK